ncbi:MAG: hypothetical protein QOE05_1460 [Actinomycetota bacterium]|nr:hypothetical protein [Actinomycetota bacterium]
MSRPITALLITAAALGGSVALAGPASAATSPGAVYVGTDNGGVQVGASVGSSPLVGAKADNSGVCVGVGYQVPQCPLGPLGPIVITS